MDLLMPNMDGYEATKYITESISSNGIANGPHIVAVTAKDIDDKMDGDLKNVGFKSATTKPISLDNIKSFMSAAGIADA